MRIGYRVSNDLPKPVAFRAVAEGLPPDWLPSPEDTIIAPFDSGEATFLVTPPVDSAEGEYELSVRLFEGGSDRWGQPRNVRIALTMPVEPAYVEPVYVAPPPAVEAPKPPRSSVPKPPKPAPKPVEPTPVPTPEPIYEPAAVVPVPVEAPEPVRQAEPEPVLAPIPAPAAQVPKPPAPKPPAPAPAPEPEPLRVRDFEPEKPREPVAPPKPAADRTVVDPKDGQIVAMRPGETVLVKVGFKNDKGTRGQTRTYVIQENRALDRDWIEVERDQATVTAGGSGFVSIRLKPPQSAEPASYPFAIETGPLGEPLTPCGLILEVLPIPSVAVACEKTAATVWFRRDVDFEVLVSVAGNSDTAYRFVPLAEPDAPAPPAGAVRPVAPVVGFWRRLVDRELGNLVSPTAGRRPAPEKRLVKLRREGIWWFGWQEKHVATLEAVPVTDGANGGKGANRVALSATRRRALPVPWFVAAPIGLVLFAFLSGGPTDLSVSNAVVEANGVSYVIAKTYGGAEAGQTVDVDLKWKNAILPSGATQIVGDKQSSVVGHVAHVDLGVEYERRLAYAVGGLMGGPRVEVEVLGQRTKNAVSLSIDGKEAPRAVSAQPLKNGARAAEVVIEVPKNGKPVTLTVKNTVPYGGGQRVYFFETKKPSAFSVSGFMPPNSDHVDIQADNRLPVKISYPGNGPTDEIWELVTTDAAMPVLRIRLKAVDR